MSLIDILIIILVIAWLGGWGFAFGGSLIHLLLVIAVILILVRYSRGERI